ncbi:MAG: Sir2 family NAD-dependent protein deacetylase [Vicinamibacterales bacterium]
MRAQRRAPCAGSWALRFPGFTLITQNVDGLHERAGSIGVQRLHGSIWDVGCWRGCAGVPHRWPDATVPFRELPPRCPSCGGPLRPGVVWFGEVLDADTFERCVEACTCDVFFTVASTSAVVYPAAGLVGEAHRSGAMTVEINRRPRPPPRCGRGGRRAG